MEQTAIFGPFFATMLLTLSVWVFMFVRRVGWMRANDVTPEQLRVPGELARLSPAEIANPSDNLKNLFELPVLFYAISLYLFATGSVDAGYVIAGWVFFALRVVHSAIHCSFNDVMMRFYAYFGASLALWFMVVRAALAHAFA